MQSKILTELKQLAKKLRPLLKKYKFLQDIIFFGSFAKGKNKPNDIDIALLVNEKDENFIESIEKDIKQRLKPSLSVHGTSQSAHGKNLKTISDPLTSIQHMNETMNIKKILGNKKFDFSIISLEDFYYSVWLSLIKEGYSVLKDKYVHEIFEIKPCILYKYSLKKLTAVQKVQFARGLNKILKDTNGTRLVRTIVIIPLSESEKFEEFLKTWGLDFETQSYELLPKFVKTQKNI